MCVCLLAQVCVIVFQCKTDRESKRGLLLNFVVIAGNSLKQLAFLVILAILAVLVVVVMA